MSQIKKQCALDMRLFAVTVISDVAAHVLGDAGAIPLRDRLTQRAMITSTNHGMLYEAAMLVLLSRRSARRYAAMAMWPQIPLPRCGILTVQEASAYRSAPIH